MKDFFEDGLSFCYPDDWQIDRKPSEEGWTVELQSPGTAFAVIQMDRTMPAIEHVAQTTLAALREDYPKLEAQTAIDMLAGEMAVGHDIEFFCLDVPTTCWTRSFYAAAGTVLVLCQVTDVDQETFEPMLRGICASMRAETE
jgi:hypothetical protein